VSRSAETSALLSGWGRTAPSLARVRAPRDAAGAAAVLEQADGRGVLARGLGRSYGDAAQNAGGDVLDARGLAAVRAFDPERGELTAGAGASLADLARLVLPRGWALPVVPGTRHVTLGGAIAADIHGKNHHVDGSFSAWVSALTLLAPGGEPRTLRPGDDAFAATVGGMGLTGIVLDATVRLVRVESDRMRVDVDRAADLDDLLARAQADDHRYRYSVAWIDCLSRRPLGRGVLIRGNHATAAEVAGKRPARAYEARRALPGPPAVRLVTPGTVRAFNELYFRAQPERARDRLQPLDAFFHPLDGVRGWNRLYGPRGFVQYQFAVPPGAEEVVRAALERLSAARRPSFLAVLKRFGPGAGGPTLSFPVPGWTLAVDLPAGDPALAPLLDGLDALVAEARGRVYLAKDARLRPELLGAMYPELARWRAVRDALDPQGRMRSDLGRRLGLTR